METAFNVLSRYRVKQFVQNPHSFVFNKVGNVLQLFNEVSTQLKLSREVDISRLAIQHYHITFAFESRVK